MNTKMDHTANFFGGPCLPNPTAKHMAAPCMTCHFAACQFLNLKKILGPPPNTG